MCERERKRNWHVPWKLGASWRITIDSSKLNSITRQTGLSFPFFFLPSVFFIFSFFSTSIGLNFYLSPFLFPSQLNFYFWKHFSNFKIFKILFLTFPSSPFLCFPLLCFLTPLDLIFYLSLFLFHLNLYFYFWKHLSSTKIFNISFLFFNWCFRNFRVIMDQKLDFVFFLRKIRFQIFTSLKSLSHSDTNFLKVSILFTLNNLDFNFPKFLWHIWNYFWDSKLSNCHFFHFSRGSSSILNCLKLSLLIIQNKFKNYQVYNVPFVNFSRSTLKSSKELNDFKPFLKISMSNMIQ